MNIIIQENIFLFLLTTTVYTEMHVYTYVYTCSQILSSAMHTLFPLKHRSHTHASEGKMWTQQLDVLT